MHVASSELDRDPLVSALVDHLTPIAGPGPRIGLVAGAPGFGKSSVLATVASQVARRSKSRIVWVSGGVVASDGHFAQILARALSTADEHQPGRSEVSELDVVLHRLAAVTQRMVIAIDDFDSLLFKRERLAKQLGEVVGRGKTGLHLLASCHPTARDRLMAPPHPFAKAVGGPIISVTLALLDDRAARTLIRRRVPALSSVVTDEIITAAGGHPAALVYLSRLAGLRGELYGPRSDAPTAAAMTTQDDQPSLRRFFDRAAEFAGAVYAEPWAALGPQQRAILWQLGVAAGESSAADVARAIRLPAPHVSAQLTRLVADGLVRRGSTRGSFSVAPLLAGWIVRRAAKSGPSVDGAGARVPSARRVTRPRISRSLSPTKGNRQAATADSTDPHQAVPPKAQREEQ